MIIIIASGSEKLDALLKPLNGIFPSTTVFSALARRSVEAAVSTLDDPDHALLTGIRRRSYSNVWSDGRLQRGFTQDSRQTQVLTLKDLLDFSLQVQNRRKSRAGFALENHLEALF